MTAHNDKFPWMSYYGHYKFFEDKMQSHNRVCGIQNAKNGLYEINLSEAGIIKVFICECYSFGLAEYYETVEKLGKIQAVIINSNWCGYTSEAKHYCREHGVGLFNIGEFMAALNTKKIWEYLTKEEKKYFKENGWL
jgi:hypothetical protein